MPLVSLFSRILLTFLCLPKTANILTFWGDISSYTSNGQLIFRRNEEWCSHTHTPVGIEQKAQSFDMGMTIY